MSEISEGEGLTGIERLLAKDAIRDCLYRYSRGVDRVDSEMLASAYWPDAIDDHVAWKGQARDLVPWLIESLRNFDQSFHCLGQIRIEFLSGTQAKTETYLFNYLRQKTAPGAGHDILQCGRYLDIFECRNGEWRIADRRIVTDWFRDLGPSPSWDEPIVGAVWPMGGRYPDDPSYD